MSESSSSLDGSRAFLQAARERLEESVSVIHHALSQLGEDQVWWRPVERLNSVGNLILHLAGNLQQRFEANIGGEIDVRDRFGEFTERDAIPKAELLRRFDASVATALTRLNSLSPDAVMELRTMSMGGREVEWTVLAILFQTLTHLAGHAQEILMMTRMQLGDRYVFKNPGLVPPAMRASVG